MEYITVIDGLAARLGKYARVLTRYNSAAKSDNIDELKLMTRSTKLVVVDYAAEQSTFTMKAMQIAPQAASAQERPAALEAVATQAIHMLNKSDSQMCTFYNYTDALKYSGLNSSLLNAIRGVVHSAQEAIGFDDPERVKNGGPKMTYMASPNFACPTVIVMFECDHCVVVLQFIE